MEALRERFGKYHVLEKLAQGGMAEVYKVKTVGIAGFEKVQALKRILPRQAREAKFIRSFIDEARIAVELTHRNIVQVFDFGKADGELFLAMELIEGKDLRTVMTQAVQRDALPPVPIAAYIISEIASGLDYAHRKADGYGGSLGIVHCDVSPSNVMLSTEGDIKILDFGIARATFASALERRRLRGKPRYMAPEQTVGETPSAASDVFALGIIAWELFTGQPLYRGAALRDILEAVRSTVPRRIDRLCAGVPAGIADAVARALSRAPAARGTAADLAGACSQVAMLTGARALAKWLARLDARPSRGPAPWQPAVTSIQIPIADAIADALAEAGPDPAGAGDAAGMDDASDVGYAGDRDGRRRMRARGADAWLPPVRPSETISLHDVAAAAAEAWPISMGTPVPPPPAEELAVAPPVVPPARAAQVAPAADVASGRRRRSTERPQPLEPTERIDKIESPGFAGARSDAQRRGEKIDPVDLTSIATALPAHHRFEPEPSTTQRRYDAVAAASVNLERHEPTVTTPPIEPERWGELWQERWYDATATTHARYGEPGPTTAQTAAMAVASGAIDVPETERFARLDDEATHHGAPPAHAGAHGAPPGQADTSYDDFEVESDSVAASDPPAPALGDAPIDDDLGVMSAGALAERRRIVVVAALLAGAAPDALRAVTKSLGELAYQRGGVVLELAPGSLIVAFGLEVAGEDDVAIAMSWAHDAAAMARDTAAEGEALQVRIGARAGVSTGLPASTGATGVGAAGAAGAAGPSAASTASAGSPVSPGTTSGRAPIVTVARASDAVPRIPDDAIDEARALAREAAPDRPLFVGGAGRLTSSLYALRELPGRRIGRRGRVIEVLGPRGFDERDRARLERRGSFIGRDAQLAELEARIEQAVVAERRLAVLITGPAGIGKSRLVAELVARRVAAGALFRVTTTACSPAGRLAPFSTVIDLYQAALGLPPSRGRVARAQVVRRLHKVLTNAGMATERARAITTDLDRAMELRDGAAVGARETADLRPRISAGLAAFRLVMTSRERPALTVVEDVHVADSASTEVLRHSLGVPASGPELLVLTARPDGLPQPVPAGIDVVLPLGDLTGSDLRALIVNRLGDAATPGAIATVLARGGGNPLFIEELAQAVRDAGAAGAAADDVPASARDVVSARIDRLPAKAKTALRFASVLGGSVRVRLLEELLGEDSLDRELDEVVAAGFLVRPEADGGAGDGELAFARGLVREVVYDSLSARAQRETHAQVGRLLASRFFAGREEPPAAIAEHLERGGEIAGAAAFWLRAGRLALSASDAGAAIACFSRTLGLERELGKLPPTATSKARRREALAGRDEAHRLQGDLAADAGDLDELAQLCTGEPARLADVSIRRAQRLLRLGDYGSASDATAIAEVHAITARDDRLRGEALRVRGEILERVGRFDEALDVVGAARELFHRQGAVADEMAAMVGRGRIHLLRAHYEAASNAYRPVLALIEQTGDPWLERIVKNHVAVIEMCLGNFAAAMRCALRSLELCRRYGDRGREGDALSVAGIVLLEVGLHDQAAAMFHDALDILSRTNSRWSRADCLIYSGICEQRRGRTGGLRMLDEALAEARQLGARYLEANALVARAGAHVRTGALSAAVADAAAGAAVARDATLVGYEIQGLARHALALARLGNRDTLASALAHRALALLDAQKYLEGSEEEVLVACAAVLRATGAHDHAQLVYERGRASALRKLNALHDPMWRAAYAAIPEVAELLA